MPRIRIAKTGGTIDNDPKDLVLDTNYTSLMIIDEVSITGTTTTYAHNLGYIPLVEVFFGVGGNWYYHKTYVSEWMTSIVDTSTIYITDLSGNTISDLGSVTVRIVIYGNAVDNSSGSGKNTAAGKLKVAKSGYNAATETDIRRLQFASGLDLIKKDTALSGTVSFTTDDGYYWEETKEITHNLGYVPMVSVIDASFGGELPLFYQEGLNSYEFYITSTKVYFLLFLAAKAPEIETYTFKYQIYRNKIA